MSIFDLYPDNIKRAKRVEELSDDSGIYLNELSTLTTKLTDSINKFHEKYKEMLLELKIDPSDNRLKPIDIDIGEGLTLEVMEYLVPLFSYFAAYTFVRTALLVRMSKNLAFIPLRGGGEVIGHTIMRRVGSDLEYQGVHNAERVAIKYLKFPKWTRFKAFAGGNAAAVVFTILIDTAFAAFRGSRQRDELQIAIEELYGPRARVKMALIANRKLKELMDTGIGDLGVIKTLGFSEEKLTKYIDVKVKQISKIMCELGISEFAKEAQDDLRRLDYNRDSYTDDDRMAKDDCLDAVCWEQ